MSDKRLLSICIVLFAILLLMNNQNYSLWEQDESAYAGFAHNMNRSGNYIIPQLDWCHPHRKPPLHFWSIAIFYNFFGENEFSTRLPSVLSIFGVLGLIYFLGKKAFNEKIAIWGSIVFMTSLFIPAYAKIGFTDASLLFFQTVCFFSILLFFQSEKKIWLITLCISIAGGTLTKGPPILISSVGCIGLYMFFFRNLKLSSKLLGTILLGLVPLLFWGYVSWQLDQGEFVKWLFDWYILKRTEGAIYNQTGPIGYYTLIFIVNFFCWIVFIPSLVNSIYQFIKLKPSFNSKFQTKYICIFWLIASWIFYEILPSKLPSYAFGAIPVLSLLVGKLLIDFRENKLEIKKWSIIYFGVLLLISTIVFYFIKSKIPFISLIENLSMFSLGLLLIGLFIIYIELSKKYKLLIPTFIFLFFFIQYFAWGVTIPKFENERDLPKRIANSLINEKVKMKHVVFSYDYSLPSILVYLERAGYTFETVMKDIDREEIVKAIQNSKNQLFVVEGKNLSDLDTISIPLNIKLHAGWVSDRGVVDSFYTIVKKF